MTTPAPTSEDIFHLGVKALLRNDQGKVLLLQVNRASLRNETRSYWDLPGGRVQNGHTVLDTLRREVIEETGISRISNVKELGMVLSTLRIPTGENESVGLILNIYECTATDTSRIALSDEHIAYDWFTVDDAAELLAVKYPQHFCALIAALTRS